MNNIAESVDKKERSQSNSSNSKVIKRSAVTRGANSPAVHANNVFFVSRDVLLPATSCQSPQSSLQREESSSHKYIRREFNSDESSDTTCKLQKDAIEKNCRDALSQKPNHKTSMDCSSSPSYNNILCEAENQISSQSELRNEFTELCSYLEDKLSSRKGTKPYSDINARILICKDIVNDLNISNIEQASIGARIEIATLFSTFKNQIKTIGKKYPDDMVYSKKAVVAYVNQICELCKAKIDYITQIQMSNATTKHQQMSEKPKYLVNLYNEQNLLVEMYKEQLSKFLKKILKISLEKMFCLPQVYFVYAKPFEEFQETESDTKIFLSTLAEHLDVAGISLVEFVNEKRILTGTQCEFSDALINGDFILTFGTRSFLARYKQGEINLASKFIFMMENCGPTTGKKQYVNLIVLNGQVESVFPTPFTRYSLITKHWRAKIDDGKGYVCYLATLIGYLYNVPTLLNREDLENDLRLLNRCIDKQAASDEKQTVGLKL